MLSLLLRFLFPEIINGVKRTYGGLIQDSPDTRDFEFGVLRGLFGGYEPKHRKHRIKTLSVKDQFPHNTCVWNSYVASREPVEGVLLSVQGLVRYAKSRGYVRGNGFSSLKEAQKAGIEFGIPSLAVSRDSNLDWPSYSNGVITDELRRDASKHKAGSFFAVKTRDEIIRALDEDRIIHTGMDWYTGYNMSGGFRAPWVIKPGSGYKVGGHAVILIGYDLDRGVFEFQNSFGADYGDSGLFYIKIDDWLRMGMIGYVTVDAEDTDLTGFIASYNGCDVKTANSPAVFRIMNGEKRPFTDPLVFHAFGGTFDDGSVRVVAGRFLDLAPQGTPMDPAESPYWPVVAPQWETIKWMSTSEAIEVIKRLTHNR